MSLFISSLNSGSNGNCYYVGNQDEAVLVDVGISCREVEKRMLRSGLSMNKVKAIFISHEHSDHIRGVEVLSRKYELPVYITEGTLKNSNLRLDEKLINYFTESDLIQAGSLKVSGFKKMHDAADPHSFVIDYNNVRVGVFTDIGAPCNNLISYFSTCHAAFLEANYDKKMLETGSYPYHLKKRIKSDEGHLSNDQALQLFNTHRAEHLSCLILAHLSRDNNHPQLVQDLFERHAGSTKVVVASRYGESAVYHVQAGAQLPVAVTARQMSLF